MGEPRIGIIGRGDMARQHAQAWASLGHPVAAVLVRALANDPGDLETGAEVFTDPDAFFDAIDLVDICVPTDVHPPFALAAAAAGKPTLCEKPFALTVDDSIRIMKAFDAAGVHLQVAHVLRHTTEYVAAREAVASGGIGAPFLVRLARLSGAPVRSGEGWFADEARSGGIVFDLMIHDLDYARWIAGDVSEVHAVFPPSPAGHVVATIEHTSGIVSRVEASWSYPPPTFEAPFEIVGTDGVVTGAASSGVSMRTREHPDAVPAPIPDGLRAEPFENELANFLAAVEGREQPAITTTDAVEAVRLATAVRESARSGRPVAL